jgi:hypothetical protein
MKCLSAGRACLRQGSVAAAVKWNRAAGLAGWNRPSSCMGITAVAAS